MKSFILALALGLASLSVSAQYAFRDTTLNDDERVDLLLKELTHDEKLHLLGTDLGVERLGIPHCWHCEGLHGVSLSGPGKEHTDTMFTTIFPQAYGLGESWDRDLVRRVADHAATELRYYSQRPGSRGGILVMRAPNADLARDPRWGRNEESFGEDAYLTSELTVAKIKGLQGDHPRYWKSAALMKHFLANSNEYGRDSTSSDFDSRLFREYYSYPFYKGITEGGSRAFMAAYNSWNGIPMAMHPCLDSITRREWGNDGIICTDGGALGLLITAHKRFPLRPEGAAAIIKAGTGQFLDRYLEETRIALAQGLLTEEDIDRAIRGNLKVALKLGLLDGQVQSNPYLAIGTDTLQPAPWFTPEARALAREVAGKTLTLLKNENSFLPLDKDKIRKIALIGPYADKIVQDWYSGLPPYEVTVLQGLRNLLGEDVEILYTPDNRMDRAVEMAREADVAIVVTGNHPYGTMRNWGFCPVPSDGREAVDRTSLMLPDEDMIRQVYAANPHTALVLVSSFPYAINWSEEHLPAILHATHCSQEQGNAVADVLFGMVNPAGHTVQTWPRDILDLPPMMDYDIRNGHTYIYYKGEPLYPFGHGLSYTTFDYSDLRLSRDDDKVVATFTLTNTGTREGAEVAQLYLSQSPEPEYRLKAFDKITLAPGESRCVTLTLPLAESGRWDEATHSFAIPAADNLAIRIGASSRDIRLTGNI